MNKQCLRTKNTVITPLYERDYYDVKKSISNEYFDATEFLTEFYNERFSNLLALKSNQIKENIDKSSFCTMWLISLVNTNKLIGYAYFDGPSTANRMVSINYDIISKCKNFGYESEVVDMMTRWVFNQKDVIMSLHILKKNDEYDKKVMRNAKYLFWDEHAITSGLEVYCREKDKIKLLKVLTFLFASVGIILGLTLKMNPFKFGIAFFLIGLILGLVIDEINYRKNYQYLVNELEEAKNKYGEGNIPRNQIKNVQNTNVKVASDKIESTKIDYNSLIIKIIIIVIFILLALYFNYKQIKIF